MLNAGWLKQTNLDSFHQRSSMTPVMDSGGNVLDSGGTFHDARVYRSFIYHLKKNEKTPIAESYQRSFSVIVCEIWSNEYFFPGGS